MSIFTDVATVLQGLLEDAIPGLTVFIGLPYTNTADATGYAIIELPDIKRVGVDQAETLGFGQSDWTMSFPVGIYFPFSTASFSQSAIAEYVENFIRAVDAPGSANPLRGVTYDVKVVEATVEYTLNEDKTLHEILYRTNVEILKSVPYA